MIIDVHYLTYLWYSTTHAASEVSKGLPNIALVNSGDVIPFFADNNTGHESVVNVKRTVFGCMIRQV